VNSSEDERKDEDDPNPDRQSANQYIEDTFGHEGRLSPQAKENIYQSFLQGWTVRDLSIRYGILPERVKAVVWCKQ
jgi:hypothetical protein